MDLLKRRDTHSGIIALINEKISRHLIGAGDAGAPLINRLLLRRDGGGLCVVALPWSSTTTCDRGSCGWTRLHRGRTPAGLCVSSTGRIPERYWRTEWKVLVYFPSCQRTRGLPTDVFDSFVGGFSLSPAVVGAQGVRDGNTITVLMSPLLVLLNFRLFFLRLRLRRIILNFFHRCGVPIETNLILIRHLHHTRYILQIFWKIKQKKWFLPILLFVKIKISWWDFVDVNTAHKIVAEISAF